MNRLFRVAVATVCMIQGLVFAGAVSAAWASDPAAALSFVVLKDDNGKPVRNAAVVLHPVNTK